jgi:anti-sigma factor ChrR (cupin superfamily)
VTEPPGPPLTARLREVLGDRPATESELRTLSEQADALARTLLAQLQASERRLSQLSGDPEASLTTIAAELRRVDSLRPELDEVRTLMGDLEDRARELRTAWLLRQADSARRS